MKKLSLSIAALFFSLTALASELPKSTAECLQQPMRWLEDPGYGNPVDEHRVEAVCSASSRTEPDNQGNDGSICVTTIARVQNGYNALVQKKQAACALVDQFLPDSGCLAENSPKGQKSCFLDALKKNEKAREQVRDLVHSLRRQKQRVEEAIPTLTQAAKRLAEIGKNLTRETYELGQSHGGDYSPEAKRNSAQIGYKRPYDGVKKINPGLKMSVEEFERYKKFIDRLVGSDVTESDRKAIEAISSPHLRQQARAIYEARRFTKGAQVEEQQQLAVDDSLTQNETKLAGTASDMGSMQAENSFNMNQALQGTMLAQQAAALQPSGSGGGVTTTGNLPPELQDSSTRRLSLAEQIAERQSGQTGNSLLNKEGANDSGSELADATALEANGMTDLKSGVDEKNGLRDKLKERSAHSGASRIPSSALAGGEASALDANGNSILDKDGNPLTQSDLKQLLKSDNAEALTSFSGPNLGGGLNLAGSETDLAVEGLVDEMKEALGLEFGAEEAWTGGQAPLPPSRGEEKQIQSAREILAADSKDLFERIRFLHLRCLQKGCVLGKQAEPL